MTENRKERRKGRGSKKAAIITISIILLVIFGGLAFGYSRLGRMKRQELPKSNEELGIKPPTEEQDKKSDILNIAFFGLDSRNPDIDTRSDSIMIVSIDKKNQKVKVTSLMRDMYVPIPGKIDNRINAAYAIGGAPLAIKTINTDFGLDVRNFVTVNFFGLEELINKVGGVDIDVSTAEAKVLNGYLVELNSLQGDKVPDVQGGGVRKLNGRQAVAYARIRYVGNGDYQRTERQREVLQQLFNKIKSQGALKLPGIIDAMIPYVETSMSNGELLGIAQDVIKFNTENLEQFRLPVDGLFRSQSIRGMSVLVPDLEANKQKLEEFIYGANQ